MAKVKFPSEMPSASNIGGNDKMMIAKEGTGETYQATFDQAKQYLTIEGQRLPAVAPGALPAGPTGQTRYMEVTAVGTWTYGGVEVGSNADGFKTTFWWTGDSWVDNGSVRVEGPMPEGTDTLEDEEIGKGKAVKKYVKEVAVISEELFNGENEPITLVFQSGYYEPTASNITQITSNTTIKSSSLLPTKTGDRFVIKGESNVLGASTSGKLVDAGGNFLKNLVPADFTDVNGNKVYVVEDIEGIVNIVFTIRVAVYTGLDYLKKLIKPSMLKSEEIGQLAANSGIVVSDNYLFEEVPDYTTITWKAGYYATSATNTTQLTASDTIFSSNLLPIPEDKIVRIKDIDISGFTNSVGKIVNASGGFVKNLTKVDDLKSHGTDFYIDLNDSLGTSFILTARSGYNEELKINGSKKAIKESLLPSIPQPSEIFSNNAVLKSITAEYRSELFTKGAKSSVSSNMLDLVIIAGQSNTDGRASIGTAPTWLTANNNQLDNFMMWDRVNKSFRPFRLGYNTGADNNADTRHAYDLYIAKNYIDTFGKKLYAIKCSRGGTSIDPSYTTSVGWWSPYYESFPVDKRKLILELAQRVQEAFDYADKNQLTLNIRACIWHQGESDNNTITATNNYYQNMKDVIEYIRGIAMNPRLPFFMGTIPNASDSFNAIIRTAQEDIAAEDENTYLIRLDDLSLFDNPPLHLDGANATIAGNRYWEEIENIL